MKQTFVSQGKKMWIQVPFFCPVKAQNHLLLSQWIPLMKKQWNQRDPARSNNQLHSTILKEPPSPKRKEKVRENHIGRRLCHLACTGH